MALPSPEEINAMMAADGFQTRSYNLPSPEQVDQMMLADNLGTDNPYLGGARAMIGATSKLLPFGDEITAGGGAAIQALLGNASLSDAYDQKLQEIRNYQKAAEQISPIASGVTTLAGGALLPSLGLVSKAKGIGQTAKALATEGGAFGALYGFDTGEGGFTNRIQNAAVGELTGAAAAPMIGGGLFVASKATKAPGAIADFIKPFFRSADDIAASRLEPYAADINKAAKIDPNNPLSGFRTLAEATQNPELATLEQTLTKSADTPGNALLNKNRAERATAQLDLLNSLTTSAPKSEEAGGAIVRQILDPAATAAEKINAAEFAAINRGGAIPVADVQRPFNKLANEMYEAGGMPGKLRGIAEELNAAAKPNVPASPIPSGLLDSFGNPILPPPPPPATPATEPFSYMHSLRQRAQDAWRDAYVNGDGRGAALANSAVRKIDAAITKAASTGGIDPADAKLFELAKSNYFKNQRTFREGPVGDILAKNPGGFFTKDNAKVPDKLFDGTAETTRKVLNAAPNDPAVRDSLRGVVRDEIFRDTATNDGILSPGKFRTWLRVNGEGLTAKTKNGVSLFDRDHLVKLDQIAEDLSFLDAQSTKSVKNLAYRASVGQPTTAQALMQEGILKGSSLVPGGAIAKTIGGHLLQGKATQVNEILANAMFDKQLAKTLASKATPQTISLARRQIEILGAKFSSLGSQSGTLTGRGSGSLSSSIIGPRKENSDSGSTSLNEKSAGAPKIGPSNSKGTGQEVSQPSPNPTKIGDFSQGDNMPITPEVKKVLESKDVKKIEALIDSDPVDAAIYEMESSRNPLAKNPTSSASGAFQLIKSTAKKIGVKDVFDLGDNYEGYLKLKEEHQARFGNDPALLYGAHYLGSTVLNKYLKGLPLTETQQDQVDYFKSKVLPKFMKIYNRVSSKTVEA